MSRAKLPLLPLFALLFILGACQGEGKIEGEVFIVTEGRENIEMGLVEVSAVETEELDKHLGDRFSTAQKQVKSSAKRTSTLLDSVSHLSELSRQVSSNYEQTNVERTELRRRIRKVENEIESIEGNLIDKAYRDVEKDEINEGDNIAIRSNNTKVYNGPGKGFTVVDKLSKGTSGKVVDTFESNEWDFYELSIEEMEGYVHKNELVSESIFREFNFSIKKLMSKKRNLENKLSKTNESSSNKLLNKREIETKIESTKKSIQNELEKVESYRRGSFLLDKLPQSSSSDKTDSDGQYELTVEADMPHYIVAQAERSVGDEKEQYYWMVKTTVEGGETKEINLSNNNLGGMADEKYALDEPTLSAVKEIWQGALVLAEEGEEMDWEKLIYRTAFPEDSTDVPIPNDLNVPEEKLLSDR